MIYGVILQCRSNVKASNSLCVSNWDHFKWPHLTPHFPKISVKRKLKAKSTYTVLIVHTTSSKLKMLIETQLTLSAQFIPSIIPHLTHLVHKYLSYTSPQMVSIPTKLSTDLLRSSLVWMGTSSKKPGVNWLPKCLERLSALDLCSSGSFIHLDWKSLLVKAGNRVQSQSKSTCTCCCVSHFPVSPSFCLPFNSFESKTIPELVLFGHHS